MILFLLLVVSAAAQTRQEQDPCVQSATFTHNPMRSCATLHRSAQNLEEHSRTSAVRNAAGIQLPPRAPESANSQTLCATLPTLTSAKNAIQAHVDTLVPINEAADQLLANLRTYEREIAPRYEQISERMIAVAECLRNSQTWLEFRRINQCLTEANLSRADYDNWRNALSQNVQDAAAVLPRYRLAREEMRRLEARAGRAASVIQEALRTHRANLSEVNSRMDSVRLNFRCQSTNPRDAASMRFGEGGIIRDPHAPNNVEALIRDSTVRLQARGPGGRSSTGSGFYARSYGENGTEQYRLITADHVATENWNDPNSTLRREISISPAGETRESLRTRFSTYGDVAQTDRRNDVSTQAGSPGPALDVVMEGNQPQVGQSFILSGHPVNTHQGQYVNLNCTFIGYYTRTGQYVMDCPTPYGTHVGGMSGGPAVDANTGIAWGVIVAQGNDRGERSSQRIVVSPIQQTSQGAVIAGQQQAIESRNCYDFGPAYNALPRSCSFNPGRR